MKYVKKTMHYGARPSTFSNAKHLRENPTKAEAILWKRLCNNQMENIHFRRQHPFNKYVPDFYAHSIKLVIELDGDIHEEKSVKFTDADREMNLNLNGLYILRFPNEEVYNDIEGVLRDIREAVIELKERKK
jgi:very-short-patch-repair endonuclease